MRKVAVFFLLILTGIAGAEPTEQALTARGIPVIRRVLPRMHGVIAEILPEYDPKTEFLYHFYHDGHAVLYAGGAFRESNSEEIKEEESVIRSGVAVKVKVGPDYVQRLLAAMTHTKFANSRNTFTCQQRLFYLLQDAGIGLTNGPYILGSTTYARLLEQGFADEQGRAFPHAVVSLDLEGTELIARTYEQMVGYEVGEGHDFLGALRGHLGYGDAEMLEDLRRHTNHPLILATAQTTVLARENKLPLEPGPRAIAHAVVSSAQEKFMRKIQDSFGDLAPNELFRLLSRTQLDEAQMAGARTLFRQAMQEAMAEVLAPFRTPAPVCTAVAAAAAPPAEG